MHCHLLIPHFFWPDQLAEEVYRDLSLTALQTLLAHGKHQTTADMTPEDWLCTSFGVVKKQDWPIAPLTLEVDGGMAEQHFWLRADPVHLQVQRDQIILADSATFSLSQAEAVELTNSLNRHFEADDLFFYPLQPDRWYLRLAAVPNLHTQSLQQVAGKNINDYLPTGTDSMQWHRWFNEIQMLFHENSINQQREIHHDVTINSVWFWGGGNHPGQLKKPYTSIYADDVVVKALAHGSTSVYESLPHHASEFLDSKNPQGDCLVVLDQLRGAGQYGDAYGWREQMKVLEQNWFAPLECALKKKQLNCLSLYLADGKAIHQVDIRPQDLWKFWQRKQLLIHYQPK